MEERPNIMSAMHRSALNDSRIPVDPPVLTSSHLAEVM